jgi:hypothetical protein
VSDAGEALAEADGISLDPCAVAGPAHAGPVVKAQEGQPVARRRDPHAPCVPGTGPRRSRSDWRLFRFHPHGPDLAGVCHPKRMEPGSLREAGAIPVGVPLCALLLLDQSERFQDAQRLIEALYLLPGCRPNLAVRGGEGRGAARPAARSSSTRRKRRVVAGSLSSSGSGAGK